MSDRVRNVKDWSHWALGYAPSRWTLRLAARLGNPFATLLVDTRQGADVYPRVEQIRASGRMSSFVGSWVTADAPIMRQVLRDNRFRTVKRQDRSTFRVVRWLLTKTDPDLINPIELPSMLVTDPPEHTRLRRLASKAFTPKAIDQLRDHIRRVTHDQLDALEGKPEADLVTDYCSRIPLLVIAGMLGIPDGETPHLYDIGTTMAAALTSFGPSWSEYRDAARNARELDDYFDMHITRLRHGHAAESLLSRIVHDGDLTDLEIKVFAGLLLGAGFITTAHLLGKAVVTLIEHPDQLASLRETPDRWPNAVEEILRHDTSIQIAVRVATEACAVDGFEVRPARAVFLLLGGANRDPAIFERPEVFDITRANARDHVSFGTGIHACLGAALARMELHIGLQSLFERFPHLALAGEPVWNDSATLNGFRHLPVMLGPVTVRAV